ncbi:hypothetical protein [Xylanibacter brevis]|uniref:hypothetical protein n=1 Tax=Xylanibacter brevis TaxID=83231 RepID=UPI000A3E3998|nr:hypothetical protein [Xylanibacter brevis]
MNKRYFTFFLLMNVIILHVYSVNTFKIDSIVVKHAPWHLETPANVTCRDFENEISYEEYHISDSAVISDIVKEFYSLKESHAKTLDVRCKLYLYSQGVVLMSACMDPYHILYDGVLYNLPPSLKNKIDRMHKNSTPKISMKKDLSSERGFPFPNGRDSLFSYLSSELNGITRMIEKTVSLTVNCQIDSHGNTIKVVVRNNDHNNCDNVKKLVTKLKEIFVNDIKWIPDKERFPFEVVNIPLKFIADD